MKSSYEPTDEQKTIFLHPGEAFVTACPGAGKTRTMVERARVLLGEKSDRRGVAFLSFTNAAVEELEVRLRTFGVLPTPLFPSFIGTFDRFLWQFFIAPFGMPDCEDQPKLIPDKAHWIVQPHQTMHPLPLNVFDRKTAKLDPLLARKHGFDASQKNPKPYESAALSVLNSALKRGQVDFDDIRACVRDRMADQTFADRLGLALAGRFREIIVDEAQDCNPADLDVVQWLRDHKICVKVICDPNQSIYQFRGGVTGELVKFQDRFTAEQRLPMTGNFRSSPAICAAIAALRPPRSRGAADIALGRHKSETAPVHILSYRGSGVSTAIGPKFVSLIAATGIAPASAPILSSRRASAAKAIGIPTLQETSHLTLQLAQSAMAYHFAFNMGNRREALAALHRTVLQVQQHIGAPGDYHRHIIANGLDDGRWRPAIIAIANALRFTPPQTADDWLQQARRSLAPGLVGGSSIAQRLRSTSDLATALASAPATACPPRTIHSAKGLEFPAVCVVLTNQKAGDILDCLEGASLTADEDARKIYVAASRAERLLAIAIPKSKAERLQALLAGVQCPTLVHDI